MIRGMLDSDQLAAIEPYGGLLASYADLVTPADVERIAKRGGELVVLDRGLGDPHELASAVDVERGALTPQQAPGWYDKRRAAGITNLTVYCDVANLPAVNTAMGNRGFFRWVAKWSAPYVVPGFHGLHGPAAIQIADANITGIHADFSIVLEDQWHATPLNAQLAGALAHIRTSLADIRKSAVHAQDDANSIEQLLSQL